MKATMLDRGELDERTHAAAERPLDHHDVSGPETGKERIANAIGDFGMGAAFRGWNPAPEIRHQRPGGI